ncbi:MAG: hypothetical protein WAW20_07415 [Anaerolineae bacterium]
MLQPITRSRSDRWADGAVIGALIAALLLGAVVVNLAQGQRSQFNNAEAGLTVAYPQGWLLQSSADLAFQAINPESGTFKTTYQARTMPIAAGGPITPTLALALNNMALDRGRQETAYRLFEISEGAPVSGQPTMEANYVYVSAPSDPFAQTAPVVVHGLDIAVARGDQAYIFSLLAAEGDAFAAAAPNFRRFVQSAALR